MNQATTKIKKEDEMKRIVFLIIASLLVIGLVLPGCDGGNGEPPENAITIAVAGPMDDVQGQHHWAGAKMARDEINAAGGVTVGNTSYEVVLVEVDTEEATEGESGTTGEGRLLAVIDDVTFVVGGFRTEVVGVYREVAMEAGVLFMNCGAATGALQFDVVKDYDTYKYWMKATPYNETFLVKSLIKMTLTIGAVLKGTLETVEGMSPAWVQDDYKISLAEGGKLRVELLMENAAWCAGMIPAAQGYLAAYGMNVTGTTLVSPTASDISTELAAIQARKPHIIFTAFSGSVGAVYSTTRVALGIPAMTIGINVPGQSLTHWANTGGKCVGEVMLDTWAVNMSLTDTTLAFFNDYLAETGDYPVYTAGTYDAIYAVCTAIEATDSLDSDVIIPWLEDSEITGVGATTAYYPMPAIEITPDELYALNETQVTDLYDLASYGKSYAQADWQVGWAGGIQQPHIAHDTVYGPGYQTGIASQWQVFGVEGHKVGVWPMDLGDVPSMVDQYGDWSFQYDGTMPLYLPIGVGEPTGGMLNIPY
jgi:branched-chain amino acid transport system substrate-binding protein